MIYLFEVGFAQTLAVKELTTYLSVLCKKFSKFSPSPNHVVIETKTKLDLQKVIDDLGGSLKIGMLLRLVHQSEDIIPSIIEHLEHLPGKSCNFSVYNLLYSDLDNDISIRIKRELHKRGKSARFIKTDNQKSLTPLVWSTQKVNEFVVCQGKKLDEFIIFKTHAVTDVFSWQKRDRGRPGVDPKSGMLPLKVARMMLNLANHRPVSTTSFKLLDPFCGSGSILMEGLVCGMEVFGLDISNKAVADSRNNLAWLSLEKKDAKATVIPGDARSFNFSSLAGSFDAIVTEGYLGPPNPALSDQPEIIAELKKLYTLTLPRLLAMLSPNGRLVIALPAHQHSDSVKMIQSLIDTCENSGYTLVTRPIWYSQPKAQVKRQICIFQKDSR